MDSTLRERVVLALLSTTREQCKSFLGLGEARCALGLIGEEVFDFELVNQPYWGVDARGFHVMDNYSLRDAIGWDLANEIARRNNAGETFDQIAKFLKEVPTDDPTNNA